MTANGEPRQNFPFSCIVYGHCSHCSGFVWRFFLFRCYLLGSYSAVPDQWNANKGTSGMICRPTVLPRSQARPLLPPGLSPFGYFSPFFYLLREIARRSAVAAPSPFFYSTHTCMYRLLTCYRFVAEICLGGKQRFKPIRSYVSPSKTWQCQMRS